MRCDCCDAELDDVDATAKFADSGNYVNMCGTCRKFLPKELKIVTRPDLANSGKKNKDDETYDPFDLGDLEDEAW